METESEEPLQQGTEDPGDDGSQSPGEAGILFFSHHQPKVLQRTWNPRPLRGDPSSLKSAPPHAP